MPRRIVNVEELSIVSVVVKFCFVGKTAETALLFSACRKISFRTKLVSTELIMYSVSLY